MNNLLYNLKYKLNLYRRYRFWKKEKCIYIHVPKAAGTSINKAIFGRTLGHYKATEIKSKFPILFAKTFKFSFVRNPWDRVLSAYKFAKMERTESMGMRNPEQYRIPEFDTFESFLSLWLVNQRVATLDFVFQPQVGFLYDFNDDLLIDFVGRLETLEEDIKVIEEKLSIKLKIPHSNSTSKDLNYRNEYKNDEMINIVRRIYHKDIETFGYEF